jgi:hypothetical protein
MNQILDDLVKSEQYIRLADKRKATIIFLWNRIRNQTLAKNQLWGRWLDGIFYSNWCDLPDEYKYNDNLLKTLPSGHFWLDGNRNVTTIRYFISRDCAGEDRKHFISPSITVA